MQQVKVSKALKQTPDVRRGTSLLRQWSGVNSPGPQFLHEYFLQEVALN